MNKAHNLYYNLGYVLFFMYNIIMPNYYGIYKTKAH